MKVIAEVVAAERKGEQRWTGASLLEVVLCASADHDERQFTVSVLGQYEKSFPVGRRVKIEITPL